MLIKPKYFLIISLFLLLGTQIFAQPEQSGICTSDRKDISAKDFCEMLKRATANGAQKITVINGQCFGGGLSCITTIGTSSSIFMKSASADTEVAWHGTDTWSPSLRDGFAKLSTVYAADTYAKGKDSTAPGGKWNGAIVTTNGVPMTIYENPQGAYKGDAGTALIGAGSSATSLHAILFAGSTIGLGNDANELNNWYSLLTTKGYPTGNITIICPASRDSIENAFAAVSSKLNINEELTVIVMDHGTRMAVDTTPRNVVSLTTVTFTLSSSFARVVKFADSFPRLILSAINTTTTMLSGTLYDVTSGGRFLDTFMFPTTATPVRQDTYVNVPEITIASKFEIQNIGTIPIEIIELRLTGGQVPRQPVSLDTPSRETSTMVISPGTIPVPPNYLRFGYTGAGIRDYQSTAGITLQVVRYDAIPPNPYRTTVLPHYWSISSTSGGDIQARVCLDYDLDEVNARGMNENTMYIAQSEDGGATWIQLPTDRNTFIQRCYTSFPVSHFSLFAIGDAGAVPVELSTLQAKHQ